MGSLNIDGKPAEFEDGETLLQACERAGADVPTLCYDPRLGPGGSCRLCMVEIEGQPQPVAACTFPASDGLRIRTESAELREYRRRVLELVLSELPEVECRHCAEIGPCQLHDLAERYGAGSSRFRGATSGVAPDDDNPFILRDYDQCIYCYRCTRICNDAEQAHAIVPSGRGFQTSITTSFGRGLMDTACTFCGQCINTCPTGALADLPRVGKAKDADVSRSVQTVCPFCGTGCTLYLDVAEERIVGARPDFESPASRGALCVKGQFGWEFVHSPDRLTTPLIRRDGELEPATWEEAYAAIAERFSAVKESDGPDALVFWSSSRATNESNYAFQRFARAAIGTNNVDNCART